MLRVGLVDLVEGIEPVAVLRREGTRWCANTIDDHLGELLHLAVTRDQVTRDPVAHTIGPVLLVHVRHSAPRLVRVRPANNAPIV